MVLTQPYIYSPPKRYSEINPYDGFDPKAHTRASLVARASPRVTGPQNLQGPQRQQMPLIDFNKHPDSWGSDVNYVHKHSTEPMPTSTKTKVNATRGIQLFLRILELICAVGLLFCVIVIKNTADTEGVVIRVPAAVDILISCYAVLHLSRAAKSRTPASSASYHFFSFAMDVALIPFYVYIALASRSNLTEPTSNKERWTTFFTSDVATNTILKTSWLICISTAGFHAASFLISGYLFVIFRRISNLPPDLNPFEENLTSRRKSKHKHKNSELTSEKHSSALSLGSSIYTDASSGRNSPIKALGTSTMKPVPFLHTRQNSEAVYSPHSPASAMESRKDLYSAQAAAYAPHGAPEISNEEMSLHSSESLFDVGSNRSHTFLSEPSSHLPTMSNVSTDMGPIKIGTIPPLPRKSSKRASSATESENWVLVNEGKTATNVSAVEEEPDDATMTLSHFGLDAFRKNAYEPLHQNGSSRSLAIPGAGREQPARFANPLSSCAKDTYPNLQPLRMNPPTPVASIRDGISNAIGPSSRPLSATSGNSISSPKRKPKAYGELSPRAKMSTERQPSFSEGEWMRPGKPANLGIEKRDFAADRQGRVLSRSGAQIADAASSHQYDTRGLKFGGSQDGFGGNGLRQVSGKAAEEGLAGHGSWWKRRASGRGGSYTGLAGGTTFGNGGSRTVT